MSKTVSGSFTGTGASGTLTTKEFAFSVSGTFSATVAIQRSFDGGTTWRTVESHTEAAEKSGDNGSECLMRLECTAYTSGTVNYVLDANRNTTFQ